MEFGSLFCDQLSEMQVVACDLCALDPPITPVLTACGHCFCWPCLYRFLHGQAKPCPVCSTRLSSDANVTPTFDDTHGALVLHLPTAEEVQPRWDEDDDMLDQSGTVACAAAAPHLEEKPSAGRDLDMAGVVFDEETKIHGRQWQSVSGF